MWGRCSRLNNTYITCLDYYYNAFWRNKCEKQNWKHFVDKKTKEKKSSNHVANRTIDIRYNNFRLKHSILAYHNQFAFAYDIDYINVHIVTVFQIGGHIVRTNLYLYSFRTINDTTANQNSFLIIQKKINNSTKLIVRVRE